MGRKLSESFFLRALPPPQKKTRTSSLDMPTRPSRKRSCPMATVEDDVLLLLLHDAGAPYLLRRVCARWRATVDTHLAVEELRLQEAVASVALIEWARARGFAWSDGAMASAAASGGHTKVLAWLRDRGRLSTCTYVCIRAAEGGHLETLQWARDKGYPWNEATCALAAKGGHLRVLEWARDKGCPWDEWTCTSAAAGGHLEVLKWARAKNCPWDKYTTYAAGRHPELLHWMRANGCPDA